MAAAAQALIAAANTFTCTFPTQQRSFFFSRKLHKANHLTVVRASTEDADCNVEECAPDKECSKLWCPHPSSSHESFFLMENKSDQERKLTIKEQGISRVGKVSVEWLAGEKTKISGTFPPRNRGWTGYVEKDTAGQTNIYSVEPAVYVAESVISSGTAGSSADGAENTAAIAAGLALIAVAAASSILLQVGKNSPPVVQKVDYSGPSLSYYINKFKPETIEALAPSVVESSQPEPSQIQVESEVQPEPSASEVSNTS
ncbi:hypothetical protein C1H46_040518 [Malus baccata]|uniref:Proline-rich family protein n=1 Tax=Malus baccata TaxID=106549 RepID=A0A540KIA2_MALBA|nr:hypothetical protein C1H46_040518 [Malus baccata]